MTCNCINTKAALVNALRGAEQPTCPEHDIEPGADLFPLALNNDAALAAKIGAHLTKETH